MTPHRARVRRSGNVEHLAVDAAEGDLLAVGDPSRGRQVALGHLEVGGLRDGHVGQPEKSALCRCNTWAKGFI